jgi:DNA-binding transcriptional LysR family regulator
MNTKPDALEQRNLMMSLRQLEIFRAVMITGSISEAARMLSIAQPSVSRILQLTEDKLGFLLFERLRGRLFPTPEAKRLFKEVETAYAGVQRVDDLARSMVEGRTGKLNIVCSPSLSVYLVPRAIARFNRKFPELPIHFEPLTHNNLIPKVLFSPEYLGISMFGLAHPNLEAEPLANVPMVCIAPRGRLAGYKKLTASALRDEPWIDYEHDTPLGKVVGKAFARATRPTPIVEVRSAISACRLVLEGVGVALVDPFCLDAELREKLDVRALDPTEMVDVQAIYSRAEPLSHSARAFIGILNTVMTEERWLQASAA